MKTKKERLASKIAAQFKSELGMVLVDIRLNPAQGQWRSNKGMFDVMPWTGSAKWTDPTFSSPLSVSIDSWDTMTDLLRKSGFTIERDRFFLARFELYAEN